MARTTQINRLRVSEQTDAPILETAVGNLADDVDTRVIARFISIAERDNRIPSPIDGMSCYITAEAAFYDRVAGAWVRRGGAADTGWIASGWSAASNWNLTTLSNGLPSAYRVKAGMAMLRLKLTKTGGSDPTASSSGNIADITVITLPQMARPTDDWYVPYSFGQVADGMARILPTGAVVLTSLSPNAVITTNNTIQLNAVYPVD